MLDVNGYNILEDFKHWQILNQYPTNQDSKISEEGLLICQAGQEGTVWDFLQVSNGSIIWQVGGVYPIPISIMIAPMVIFILIVFFFNDTATTEIYTLSLHDALPI